MKKAEQLYEGKAKKVFKTDDSELLIVEYKDDATAFKGLKKGTIKGKGVSFMENTVHSHYLHVTEEILHKAYKELGVE